MKLVMVVLLIFLISIQLAYAEDENHMTLLAVKGSGEKLEGSFADLFLKIVPGEGRVFIESFPLTKLDTQISTRFAKEIACDYTKINCDKYDFFYTIKSASPIIGGPSAGAAIAVLTVAVLNGEDVRQDIAMTGTINSGGLIGPVSGLRQKVEIAGTRNISKVLIPSGQERIKEMNLSWDLKDYAQPLGVDVVEVTDIDEAVNIFTGNQLKEENITITISEDYEKIMQKLAFKLCNRTKLLKKESSDLISCNKSARLSEEALNLTKKSREAMNDNKFYSAASYCFGANVKYRRIIVSNEKPDFNSTRELIKKMDANLENIPIKTITDLETYMVVKERLKDSEANLDKAIGNDNLTDIYAYVIERIFSAESWAEFFGKKGNEFVFDKNVLKKSCINKIGEAEERKSYVDLFIPLEDIQKELESAYEDMNNEDYELCLFQASKAKSEADAIISLMGVDNESLDNLIENKLNAVKKIISEQIDKGNFPIVGYSYYEYANSLKEDDATSALLYAEYALELSNLDFYFKGRYNNSGIKRLRSDVIAALIIGLLVGLGIGLFAKKKLLLKPSQTSRRGLRGKKR